MAYLCFCFIGKVEARTFDCPTGEVNTLCINTKSGSILICQGNVRHVISPNISPPLIEKETGSPKRWDDIIQPQRPSHLICTVEYFAAGPGSRTPVVRLGSKCLNSLNHLTHLGKKLNYTKFIKCILFCF